MKKVLLIGWKSLKKGGIQSVMMSIVRNLHFEYQFDIVLFTDSIEFYDEEFESYGGHIFRLVHYKGDSTLKRKIDPYMRSKWLRREIKEIITLHGPYCAIHCNNGYESAFILESAYECGVKTRITHAHSVIGKCYFPRTLYNSIARRKILKFSTSRIGCSEEACVSLFGRHGSFKVYPNPYDDTKYKYTPNNNCEKLIITQVGRLCKLKNQEFTIRVINSLKEKGIDCTLNLVGDNFEGTKGHLLKLINDFHLEEKIHFYPSDVNIPDLLKTTSFTLLPSYSEGFGIVAIESQASGVKCYSSDKVPKTTDCSGCVYLSLELGPDKWAEIILEDFIISKGQHHEYDCHRFSESYVMNLYNNLYCE